MFDGIHLDLGLFLARQLHSAIVSPKGRILIGGIVTAIARFSGIEPNPRVELSDLSGLIKLFLKL